jgi:hypothetical protein
LLKEQTMSTPPRWDLTNVYPSLDSKEYEAAVATVKEQIDGLEKLIAARVAKMDARTPLAELSALVGASTPFMRHPLPCMPSSSPLLPLTRMMSWR